jgi:hypothetical protein
MQIPPKITGKVVLLPVWGSTPVVEVGADVGTTMVLPSCFTVEGVWCFGCVVLVVTIVVEPSTCSFTVVVVSGRVVVVACVVVVAAVVDVVHSQWPCVVVVSGCVVEVVQPQWYSVVVVTG